MESDNGDNTIENQNIDKKNVKNDFIDMGEEIDPDNQSDVETDNQSEVEPPRKRRKLNTDGY